MRLVELLDPNELKRVEKDLNRTEYSPPEEIEDEGEVVDLELPLRGKGREAHFYQRARERNISAKEINQALKKGARKLEPDMEWLSSDESAEGEKVEVFDPATGVFIPLVVDANPDCLDHPEDTSVCSTKTGREPKHQLVAKTVFKKGR